MLGEKVGNYRVIRLLGRGGMGAVYEAEHPVIGLRVALKVLHRGACEDPSIVERFFSEARVVAAIGHPHILDVTDFGETPDGRPYLAMELLEGETLAQRLARVGALPASHAAAIAAHVADALAAAHARGVVHRDVKPHNIFLVRREGIDFVKVLDFGIAKLTAANDAKVTTESGRPLGTPAYMAPEQCAGRRDIDARADVYALGVVLFEMATGRTPFEGEGAGAYYVKHMQMPPPEPRRLVPDLPRALEAIILRALEKSPAARFATIEEMRMALLPLAVQPVAERGTEGGTVPPVAASAPPTRSRLTRTWRSPVRSCATASIWACWSTPARWP